MDYGWDKISFCQQVYFLQTAASYNSEGGKLPICNCDTTNQGNPWRLLCNRLQLCDSAVINKWHEKEEKTESTWCKWEQDSPQIKRAFLFCLSEGPGGTQTFLAQIRRENRRHILLITAAAFHTLRHSRRGSLDDKDPWPWTYHAL